MLVCIGSRALSYRNISCRKPRDLDLVGSYQEVVDFCKSAGIVKSLMPIEDGKKIVSRIALCNEALETLIVEAEIAWRNSSATELVELVKNDSETIIVDGFLIPSIHVLYMLKMSHRYLKNSPFFLKTMEDIHLLRSLGAKIKKEHMEFFGRRKKATYTYSHPKLDVNKSDFFKGDGITYVYDHDSIHEAIKHLEEPAYTYFKEPGSEVFCSKEMFFSSDEKIRNYAVLEEAYVLALERSQIPFRGSANSDKSFDMALSKICTSITSGWFREYSWENWYNIKGMQDPNYAKLFFEKADAGLVKLYGG